MQLLPGIIDFYPIAIRIFKVDLFDPIWTSGDSEFLTGPVSVINSLFLKVATKLLDRFHRKTEVVVFGMFSYFFSSFNQVQVGFGSNAKPGMFAIVKRFRDRVKPNDILVKSRAFF